MIVGIPAIIEYNTIQVARRCLPELAILDFYLLASLKQRLTEVSAAGDIRIRTRNEDLNLRCI